MKQSVAAPAPIPADAQHPEESVIRGQLALFREVIALANPRFGLDHVIRSVMDRLRAFYDADDCLLIMAFPGSTEYRLYRVSRHHRTGSEFSEPAKGEVARRLLSLPHEHVVVYNNEPCGGEDTAGSCCGYDLATGRLATGFMEPSDVLATALNTKAFVTVPIRHYGDTIGRLYITSPRLTFTKSDADILLQAFDYITPIIENVRLVDSLASGAAEQERRRIALDLHDSAIQPYIGIQLGLAAVQQKLEMGVNDVLTDIKRLISMADAEIEDLRRYISDWKVTGECAHSFLRGVERIAEKFRLATGIPVKIEAAEDLHFPSRLTGEAFQIIAEGLSNIRRHTQTRQVTIAIEQRGRRIVLQIMNCEADGSTFRPFTPRSITERAAALGGRIKVKRRRDGGVILWVEIPL